MSYKLRFSQYNERSILIEWPAVIDENILQDMLLLKEIVENKYIKQSIQIISAYNSILIFYNHTIDNVNDKVLDLKMLYSSPIHRKTLETKILEESICFVFSQSFGECCHLSMQKKYPDLFSTASNGGCYQIESGGIQIWTLKHIRIKKRLRIRRWGVSDFGDVSEL